MARYLNFQIQKIRSRSSITQIEIVLHVINACLLRETAKITVDFCPQDDYCNLQIRSSDPTIVWNCFSKLLADNPNEFDWIKARWIVVLQGELGWEDYFLLAHFKRSIQPDPKKKWSK